MVHDVWNLVAFIILLQLLLNNLRVVVSRGCPGLYHSARFKTLPGTLLLFPLHLDCEKTVVLKVLQFQLFPSNLFILCLFHILLVVKLVKLEFLYLFFDIVLNPWQLAMSSFQF
jgi:hypothetical protein